jgi:SagB-type dehydrogenase family enzyme
MINHLPMTSDAVLWTYSLAPDVEVIPGPGGAFLRTATSQIWVEAPDELKVIELLANGAGSEAQLHGEARLEDVDRYNTPRYAALLFRLDRRGLLARSISSWGRRLASCIPLRPPPEVRLEYPPLEGELRLSPVAHARADAKVVCLEAPGSWARMTIHDRNLLPLLHDLAVGRQAAQMAGSAAGHCEEAILAVLALMNRCGLLDTTEQEGWSGHDLYFHARTRRGYARAPLGKTYSEGGVADQSAPVTMAGKRRLSLEPPDLPQLIAKDPPYALVSERRQSIRRHGSVALTSAQLSEFLFRTLYERSGHRPYPSGGACYPLKAYLAVHRCRGIRPGFYSYDSGVHELISVAEPGHRLDKLLTDAASAANVDQRPQILLVLAARYGHVRRFYGDLSYSLILKEVGAVIQTAMMAAAAMGLATCPLGCGDSVLFSELIGVNPHTETSVGELMLGSLE